MAQFEVLLPLQEITVDRAELLAIQRDDLVPLLNDQYRLNHYADQVIQAQSVLLDGVDRNIQPSNPSATIEQLIQALGKSKKVLKQRKFNALQKWLGIDLEYGAGQVQYYKNLDHLLGQADRLAKSCKSKFRNHNHVFSSSRLVCVSKWRNTFKLPMSF